MTKTIFSITPFFDGNFFKEMTKIAMNHNSGRIKIDFDVFESFAKADYATYYTNVRLKPSFKMDNANGILEIYEGENISIRIEEKIINELQPVSETQGEVQN